MTDEKILTELNSLFRLVFDNPSLQIDLKTSGKDIDNWNSMNHILLINEIEKHFAVEFEFEDLIMMNNVEEILTALQTKISE